jgi:hypothetical protein
MEKEDPADIAHRFASHPAGSVRARQDAHEMVRLVCRETAQTLNHLLPASQEAKIAVRRLEEVMFWANAAIARNPED